MAAHFVAVPDETRAVPGRHDDAHHTVEQFVQIVGAVLVLSGFLLAQADVLDPRSIPYLVPNAVGSAAMAATAVLSAEWGFVLLEGVWALVSAWGIAARSRDRTRHAAHRSGRSA